MHRGKTMRNEISIKFRICLSTLFALVVALAFAGQIALAQTSSFTYQGKLADSGVAANGTYDITFKLFDMLANGTQVGTDIVRDNVVVSDGGFTVDLDFGAAAFASGASRFLQLEVRPGASVGTFTTLVPRQPLTSSPYAVKAASASFADSLSSACALCVTDAHIFSIDGGKVTGAVANATNVSGGTVSGNGSGLTNLSGGNLASNSITADKFSEAAVTEYAIREGNVTTTKIADGAVTNSKLAAGSVDATHLTALSVTSAALGDGSVKTEKIGDGAVTTGKIADEAVTGNKIKTGAAGTLKWFVASGNADILPNTGVVVEATNEIRLRLPDSPSPGDFFRVVSSNTGGFRITQNGTQSISVSNGSVPRIYWTPRETVRAWKSIASSSDGTRVIAAETHLGGGQPTALLYVSTDSGVTWSPRESERVWSSVASSADGMRLIASVGNPDLGASGLLYVSSDGGTTWTPRETPRQWTSVASSVDGTKLVAAVSGGQIYTSVDSGATWVPRDTNRGWLSVASSSDGTTLVATEGRRVYMSTDSGETWTVILDLSLINGARVLSVASSADGTKLIAGSTVNVTGGPIYVSTDAGATWTPRGPNAGWNSVTTSVDGMRLAAVSDGSQIHTSNDGGVTWTPTESARAWRSIASSADGEKLFAVADNAPIMVRGRIQSTPGIGGGLVGTSTDSVELVYVGAGKFLIVDLKGSVTLF